MKCQISLVLGQSTSINFEMSVTFVNKKIVTRGALLLVGQAHVSHKAWLGEIWFSTEQKQHLCQIYEAVQIPQHC